MNLIEKWRNRETKQKLREEVLRLQAENKALRCVPMVQCMTVERNVQKVISRVTVDRGMPTDFAKVQVKRQFTHMLEPFIEWDVQDGDDPEKITLTGCLYVATKGGDSNEQLKEHN